jgi:hypothetical protein
VVSPGERSTLNEVVLPFETGRLETTALKEISPRPLWKAIWSGDNCEGGSGYRQTPNAIAARSTASGRGLNPRHDWRIFTREVKRFSRKARRLQRIKTERSRDLGTAVTLPSQMPARKAAESQSRGMGIL